MSCVFAERWERRKLSLKRKVEYFLRGLSGLTPEIRDKDLWKMLDVLPVDLIPPQEKGRWLLCKDEAIGECEVCGRSACERHLTKYTKYFALNKTIAYRLCAARFGKLLLLNRTSPTIIAASLDRSGQIPIMFTRLGVTYTVGECPNCGTTLAKVETARIYRFSVEGEERCLKCDRSLGIYRYKIKNVKQ